MNTTHNPVVITAEPGTPFMELTREFAASPELVFRAQTDPAIVVQWLRPCDLTMRIEEWDARSGGCYRYVHTRDGFEAGFRGVFHTVSPSTKIIQTFEYDGAPDQVCLEIAEYEDLGDGRTLLRSRSVFPSVEARDAALASGMENGIRQAYELLDDHLAGRQE